ncbi:hypothetical protein QWJ26_36915 [Streptomyces sp. CSDS2]|uniref:hypothetical protein n=1 Tax=Streptomyces sp. CSDS2 TaxID=3055051 RepID=UPI0025AF3485|nr:hypothetical protein [Streptomyces sp. CSDS2]MDN3265294.1 hypothetical protein [Streptomyces sp. CSDS2]
MGTTIGAQTVRFLSPEWAEAARVHVDSGPGEDVVAAKQESYWEWIAQTRAACSQSWALGVREADGTTSYLRLEWRDGKCAAGTVIAPGEPVEADFVLVGSAQTWRRFYAGELNLQRTVVDRKLSLERGDTLIFFRSIFFFVESLAALQQVPTSFD